jgi:hypothetical protein
MGEALVAPVEGPAPETEIVKDIAKRAALVTPVAIVLCGLIWGAAGALSATYGIAIVLANFTLAAVANARAARISTAALGAVSLFGFLIRLGLIFMAFLLVKDAWWMAVVPFGITVVAFHLGLLFWEMKYISASLAFPALKPSATSEES